MKVKNICSSVGLLLLVSGVPQAMAVDSVQADVSFRMTMPSGGEMNLMSDDPLVQEIIRRQHDHQRAAPQAANAEVSVRHAGREKKWARANDGDDKPEIIKLDVPENLPEVVNRNKSFVFRDITDRSNNQTSQQLNSAKRINQIEMLRRSVTTHQD